MTDSSLLMIHAWVIAAIDAVRWFWPRALLAVLAIGLLALGYLMICTILAIC